MGADFVCFVEKLQILRYFCYPIQSDFSISVKLVGRASCQLGPKDNQILSNLHDGIPWQLDVVVVTAEACLCNKVRDDQSFDGAASLIKNDFCIAETAVAAAFGQINDFFISNFA